ncbi:MAG: flavodoxin family protein [Deltaproteobacteria bacterium]|jgi:multimeric flavodoxin WrbA|nr:flavodoxin family protein [Deltaproteobacteria bacterium]
MKVTLILGSPRPGSNSAKLAEAAVAALPDKNVEVKKFNLNQLRFRGCQSCFSCKGKTETCVLKDDLALVMSTAADSDLVILTSPVYINEVAGQVKCFIDRTYSWFKPDFMSNAVPGRLKPGKKMLFIWTQGNPDKDCYKHNLTAHVNYFGSQGFKVTPFVACGLTPEDVGKSSPGYLKQIAEVAAAL